MLAIQFARKLIGPLSIDRFGGKQRRNLLLLAQEPGQNCFHSLGGNVFVREETVDFLLAIVRGGGGPEGNPRQVLFVVFLQRLCLARSGADAYKQDTRGQGIEGPRMSHLQVLLSEVFDCSVLNLSDDIGRCPAVRLVHGKDNSLRIGINRPLQRDTGRSIKKSFICNQRHYAQGILLIRRSWRAPSKEVVSQVLTMRVAMA